MNTKRTQNKTVFVGLSGGVDSAVSAALLKQEGYDVVGVFMKTWHPDFLPCTWREDRMDAMRVAAHLGVPFLTFDLEEAYKKGVAEYLIREYAAGRTPNPDVMCNKEVKFGAFLTRARAAGADFVATGHYARRVVDQKTGTVHLMQGVDRSKDQSYFLWTLGQEELAHALFPIGDREKFAVRALAKKFGLPNAERKDSQGVCFIGELDMKAFLKHFIETKPGVVLDTSGSAIGMHDGAVFYTIGERHGFTITAKTAHDRPYYVVAKDHAANTITVAHEVRSSVGSHTEVSLEQVHWIIGPPGADEKLHAHIRYHGEDISCRVAPQGTTATVSFAAPLRIASGQSVVFYRGAECIGGGVVQ